MLTTTPLALTLVSDNGFLSQGDEDMRNCTVKVLLKVFDRSRLFLPAAVKGKAITGLVHLLMNIGPPDQVAKPSHKSYEALAATLDCLRHVLVFEVEVGKSQGACKIMVKEGADLVVLDLLKVPDEETVIDALGVAAPLLGAPPCGWAPDIEYQFLRAIAALITSTATPALTAFAATKVVWQICNARPGLLNDFRRWGIVDAVRQLSKQSHPRIGGAADRLLSFVQEAEVSTNHLLCSFCPVCRFPVRSSTCETCCGSTSVNEVSLPVAGGCDSYQTSSN